MGSFVQLPIKLAYAITIHKSQDLSLESVYLKLGSGCFAHGQLYTAISRCRTLKTLRIDRPLYAEDIVLDEQILEFYSTLEQPKAPPKEVKINIPKEHEAAVLKFLEQLRNGNAPDVAAVLQVPPKPVPAQTSTPTFPPPILPNSHFRTKNLGKTDIFEIISLEKRQKWQIFSCKKGILLCWTEK